MTITPTGIRVAGCDLGKATAKFVVGAVDEQGELTIVSTRQVPHEGRPADSFCDWYVTEQIHRCAVLGATGVHADEIKAPAICGLPSAACLEAALQRDGWRDGPLNIISVGARGYGVLSRDANGHVRFLENEKCSSGTGETMVKIAGRFGLSIEEADRQARAAGASIPITARCSVFAKSEMTHFANQGRPTDQLLRGYFTSVAAYVAALAARARVPGPVHLVGGGGRIKALISALEQRLDTEVSVPEDAMYFEALGAAMLALEHLLAEEVAPLPASPEALLEARDVRFLTQEPASDWAHRVVRLEAPSVPEGAWSVPSVLGLDLGSTGSKAVLTSIETGEAVLDLYDRTRGNPVDASQRLISSLRERAEVDVRAVGLTGSGREAAATVIRAAFPELADRVVVVNEIVAHATAAIRCDPDSGESLSVVEIGGQDAKFIQIVGGQIVESDMNKACSAGTGSFLEEQAVFYGIEDIETFTRLAMEATRPPDLGQMCTVFVAEAAALAHNEGFATADIFAGFQYSVIYNYINRVMGQRPFGQRIFFQGKPACGPSLAWTLAAVAEREVVVPAKPGAMGAWGVGLCAVAGQDADALLHSPPLDLWRVLEARVVARSEFQCRDKGCATLCSIERTTVSVGETSQKVLSGGACPRYEISTAARPKLPLDVPDAFNERLAALAPYLEDQPGEAVVHVPLVGACLGVLPWLVTFVGALGFGVKVLRPDRHALRRGEERCYAYDSCAPAKIAHGVLDTDDVEVLFFPKLLTLPDRDSGGGATCSMEQALPEIVREALAARGRTYRFVTPHLALDGGPTPVTLLQQALAAAEALGASRLRVPHAMERARAAQRAFERELVHIGQRTLTYGETHGLPVVVVCGMLHVILEPGVNANIQRLLRENGVLAMPMDCYSIPPTVHSITRVNWCESRRVLRAALHARSMGSVYPLLLSAFGCGPNSFVEQIFARLMEGYPHTVLESDGHGGAAGYVTRVQAFLHTVRHHDKASGTPPARWMRLLDAEPETSLLEESEDTQFIMLSLADRVSPLLAATYRSFGLDATSSGPCDAEALKLGRRDCSGKECLPYQLLWGAFRKHLQEAPPDKPTVLLQVANSGTCRNCMFAIKDQMSLAHMGLDQTVTVRTFDARSDMGLTFQLKGWSGAVAWDILNQLVAYHRPLERTPGVVDRWFQAYCDELEALLERPWAAGARGLIDAARHTQQLKDMLARASQAFARLERQARPDRTRRTILLSGDVFLRLDDYASDFITPRLNRRGLQVLVEPLTTLSEYMNSSNLADLMERPSRHLENATSSVAMARVRRALYAQVRPLHPWLPASEIASIRQEAQAVLAEYPLGEAPITIGSVLHHWKEGMCDGAVVISPWGCAPALIAEGMLRHQLEIPILYIYSDGSPIDDQRLNAFCFQLRRNTACSRAPRRRRSSRRGM